MKPKDNFLKLLTELVNDESMSITNEYMKKVEKLISMYTDIFVKPQFQGKDKLCKIKIDSNRQYVDIIKKNFAVGEADREKGNILIKAGFLKDIPLGRSFQERRNLMIIEILGTVSHEARHFMQVRYRKELEAGAKGNKKRIELYKSILGEDCEEIARSTKDAITNNQFKVFADFYSIIHPEMTAPLQELREKMQEQESLYYASIHEQDARQASLNAIQNLMQLMEEKMEQDFEAYKFPERFEEVCDIFEAGLSFPEKNRKRRKGKDDLFSDMKDLVEDFQDIFKGIGKSVEEVKKRTAVLQEDMFNATDGILKQATVELAAVDAMVRHVDTEIENETVHEKQLSLARDQMKKLQPADFVIFAREMNNMPGREVYFNKIVGALAKMKYVRDFFRNKDNMRLLSDLLKNYKLDWAAEQLDDILGKTDDGNAIS